MNQNVSFSDAQREAVTFGGGPLLVLAGPGSGKTFVITQRVKNLIEEKKADPRSILVLTFSRAAAREMEERFLRLVSGDFSAPAGGGSACRAASAAKRCPTFGTFHSFFFSVIRTAYGYRADQVVTQEERLNTVRELICSAKIESGDLQNLAVNLLSEISLVKEARVSLENYYSVNCPAEVFRGIFRGYETALGRMRKIDYEDMLVMTYELLKARLDIREALTRRYQWILIDEFQDINRLQYEIVRMIAGETKNLTIVGDDDQSIYRFRGAKPEIMLGFQRDYPEAERVLLDINFRSTPEIVKTAGRLIQRNKKRFPKAIRAARPSGKPVNTVVCPDPSAEADYLVREIRSRVREGLSFGDIAVLYRTNLQPRILASRLMAENIPFRLQEALPDLMDHWIARDVAAYLRLSRNIPREGDLLRIMNRPNRYIRREAVRMEGETLEGLRRYYQKSGQTWMFGRLNDFSRDLKMLAGGDVYQAVTYIRKEIGYDRFLKSYAEEHMIDPEELTEILDEVQDSAEGFRYPEDWFSHMKEFRLEIQKKRAGAEKSGAPGKEADLAEDRNQVHLMTFHASKGLEFPVVFLIDVNKGIVPHRKAFSRDDLEEERRMFYVAMTRARDELVILTCRKRFHRDAEESSFIEEYEKQDSAGRG